MSVSVSVYIGPYVECRIVSRTATRSSCKKPAACEYPAGGSPAYCPGCGIPAESRSYTVEEKPEVLEMAGSGQWALHPDEDDEDRADIVRYTVSTWRRNDLPRKFNIGDLMYDGDQSGDLTDVDKADEIDWLLATCADAVAELCAAYGSENVRARWGFIASVG